MKSNVMGFKLLMISDGHLVGSSKASFLLNNFKTNSYTSTIPLATKVANGVSNIDAEIMVKFMKIMKERD